MAYSITIGGIDRVADVLATRVLITDSINDKINTCSLHLMDLSGNGIPSTSDEITIIDVNGTTVFTGYVTKVDLDDKARAGDIIAKISCVDQTWILDQNLVHKTYEDMTDKEIIEDIINTYCPGTMITTTNVVEGVTIDQISFNYIQPSQAFRQICDLTGRNWYIDYDKDVHYFPLTTETAPYDIDSSSTFYSNLDISKDLSQLRNRVYVRGGTTLSDYTTYSELGDGEKRQFVLPDKPHDITVEVNSVEETVGIKNIDDSGFDWYVNFQEKYIEQDSGGTTLTSSDTLDVTYKYDIPVLVAVEDTDSIAANGQREFAIFDKSITTTTAARDRASGELTDYANNLVEAIFDTIEPGFASGQYMNINLSTYGVNDDYIIQSVRAKSIGGGQFNYTVRLASAKTMGIIRFLIELLEANKNLIELDDQESVDELLSIQDSLLSDSIVDDLTIDSQGAYFTWVEDSPSGDVQTRMRWDLFQWG